MNDQDRLNRLEQAAIMIMDAINRLTHVVDSHCERLDYIEHENPNLDPRNYPSMH